MSSFRVRAPSAIAAVWVFNTVGSADLVYALTRGVPTGAAGAMGAAYWIPAVLAPALLVTHFAVFVLLVDRSNELRE